jgi:CSLREA domain-containing protein
MLNGIFRRIGFTTLAILTLAPAALRADTFLVTRFVDKNDGACGRDCSLREAVLAANQHPGFDAILLPPGTYRLSIAGTDEDLGATGDLDVADDLLIIGPGPGETVIDGGGIDRVLDVHAPASVALNTLTIRHGRTDGTQTSGGGIRNTGYLAVNASVVTGNSAPGFGFGGGIYSDGAGSILTLDASTVAGNTAQGGGGGLAVGGRLEVRNSTLSGNRSVTDFGGGAYLFSEAVATFNNATVTANRAAQRGGGLFAEQPLTAPPRLASSILAANAAPADPDCLGSPVSGGYNLIGQGEGCPNFQAALGDLVGTAAAPLDPRLSRLSDNGGPTPTHALLPGSPAINAGNPAPPGSAAGCQSTDQRLLRRGNSRCDIGSFERGAR